MKPGDIFESNWEKSNYTVLRVGTFFQRITGLDLYMPVPFLQKRSSNNWKQGDQGDLHCKMILEVKQRKLVFPKRKNGDIEWYPYPTIFVDEEYKLPDEKKRRLFGYAIVNHDCSYLAFIHASTRKHWIEGDARYDEIEKRPVKNYECPRELAQYIPIVDDVEPNSLFIVPPELMLIQCPIHGETFTENCLWCAVVKKNENLNLGTIGKSVGS